MTPEWYKPEDMPDHQEGWARVREFNELHNTDPQRARELLAEMFPHGETPNIWAPIHLEYGVNTRFGAGAMVMPGVTVGDRCVVAAGAVVTRDLPADSLAAGVPATVKRNL